MVPELLDLAPLAVFAFGALTFSILTAFYWRDRHSRAQPGKSSVFPAFTLVCAAAFLSNLLFQAIGAPRAGTALVATAILIRNLTTSLLPLLILHLVFEITPDRFTAHRIWRWLYATATFLALLRGLNQTGLLNSPWSDALYHIPAATLAAAAAMGLVRLAFLHSALHPGERAHRRWIVVVLALLLASATANLVGFAGFVVQMPDYLLLAFFCISLYYRERLVFFDLLVKQGVFLALGLILLTAFLAIAHQFLPGPASGWSAWMYIAGLFSFWLAGPWVYSHVVRAVDHRWLRRPYSPAEAERQFTRDLDFGSSEDELRDSAAGSLSSIFQSPAEVRFDRSPFQIPSDNPALSIELKQNGARLGYVRLAARPNGIPFLSDDRRLLQSLAGTLSLMLENIRFRADRRRQEEREQQLRWLASRAELKALRAQINPHFLFNTLSVIAGLLHYQPELAEETIERLAQVLRYTLRKSDNEWAPLAEEIEFVTAYLRIEQARFGQRLNVEFDVDAAAARIPIPAMSIQPLVENAIRHGVSTVAGPGAVKLRAALQNGVLSIEVCDNGPGFPPGFCLDGVGDGHGLRNVAERVRGYYGEAARLSWENGRDGTRVMLKLPQGDDRDTRADC